MNEEIVYMALLVAQWKFRLVYFYLHGSSLKKKFKKVILVLNAFPFDQTFTDNR